MRSCHGDEQKVNNLFEEHRDEWSQKSLNIVRAKCLLNRKVENVGKG